LCAFLTTAGHLMARKSPDDFAKLVSHIQEKVLPRLDEAALGAATRLKHLMSMGFDGFLSTLPEGAIAELYVTSDSAPAASSSAVASSFGRSTSNASSVQTISSNVDAAPFSNQSFTSSAQT